MDENAYKAQHVRGRFRFGLRTLFVMVTAIAAVAGWLGYEYRIVHERQEVRRPISENGGTVALPVPHMGFITLVDLYEPTEQLSLVRRTFGDESLEGQTIMYPQAIDESLKERIARAFPEAEIQVMDEFALE